MAIDDFVAKEKPSFKVEMVSADHQNKGDIAPTRRASGSSARRWMWPPNWSPPRWRWRCMKIAKEKNRIALISGAASTPITNETATTSRCTGPTTPTRWPTARPRR
jgi:branched-chain amino acid transport system substrate-binding protein